MQKELTINVNERVYDELQRIGGPEDISQFIESLILPQLGAVDLDSALPANGGRHDARS